MNHIQVNTEIGFTFARILRSVLRQDPDVILVGEIRDLETAKIATEAALTGHFVLTTLHTNNAIQAIVRLVEIGVDPFMVAPSTIGVLGQRLLGYICRHCKKSYYPEEEVLKKYFIEEGLYSVPFYRGRGCAFCNGTGFVGRVAVLELMEMSDEMRTLVSINASLKKLTKAAKKIGYNTMRYDGIKKALLGLITLEQVESDTVAEYHS